MELKEFVIECSPKNNQYYKFHEINPALQRFTDEHFGEAEI